jgi:hypothetical protein
MVYSHDVLNKFTSVVSMMQLFILFVVLLIFPYYSSFNYQATSKSQVVDVEAIKNLFAKNADTSQAGLDLLLRGVNKAAYCYPVSYGGISWGASDVSPMCNCLRNVHLLYTVNFLDVDISDGSYESLLEKNTNMVEQNCLSGIRPTQYEELLPTSHILTTNLLAGALMWNTLSTVCGIRRWQTFNWMVQAFLVVLCTLPIIVIAFMVGWERSITFPTIVAILYALWVSLQPAYAAPKDDDEGRELEEPMYQINYWVQYGINLGSLLVSFNVCAQRRDYITVIIFLNLGLILGLLQIAWVTCNTGTGGADVPDKVKKMLGDYVWYISVFIIGAMLSVSMATPMVSPFSNVSNVMIYTLVLLLASVLLRRDHSNKIHDLATISDLAAKLLFTVALLCDLVNIGSD